MKKLLLRHYHLVLLGIASLIALASAAFLITQSLGFQDSLKGADSISKKERSPASTASSNAVIASTHLTQPVLWKTSDNGSSPLVSRPYLLKEGKLLSLIHI